MSGLLCACDAGEPVAAAPPAPIINGEREPDYPGVVALMVRSGETADGFCSGAVIGPYAVLTAKHCVDGIEATDIYVGKGEDVSRGFVRDLVPGYEIRATPGRYESEDLFDGTTSPCCGAWCLPEGRALGAECTADDECRSGRCAAGACTRECSPGSGVEACPEGFACEGADGASRLCRAEPGKGGGCDAAGGSSGTGAW